MSKRKQSTYQIFSVVLVVGLALLGTMVCAQDKVTAPQTEIGSARDVRTSSGLGEPTAAKSVVGKAYSNSVGQPRLVLSSLPGPAQPVVSATLGQEDARYQVRRAGGGLSADNPGQSIRTEFTRRGLELRVGRTHWHFALAGYGYGSVFQRARSVAPLSRANLVEYHRGPLPAWYKNGPLGLEQGFTLIEPPGHHSNQDKGEPLTIALALGGDLNASADSPGKRPGDAGEGLILRDRNGRAVLRYVGLTAHDATGQELLAWLQLEGDQLRLRVDDAKARYPVVVDPFV